MECNETALKHRNALLSAILQCDGMVVQYLTEMIEEYNLDVAEAVELARKNSNGFSLNTLSLYLLKEAYAITFANVRLSFDPDDEYDLDVLKFGEQYLDFHLGITGLHITIKDKLAIENGWPEVFVKSLTEKINEI